MKKIIFFFALLSLFAGCIYGRSISQINESQYLLKVKADMGRQGSAKALLNEMARQRCGKYQINYEDQQLNPWTLEWEIEWIIECSN